MNAIRALVTPARMQARERMKRDDEERLANETLRRQLFAERRKGAAVARELGLSRERVSQWKRGETKIPPRHHHAIEAILRRRARNYQIIDAILQQRDIDKFIAKYGRGAADRMGAE